MKKDSALFKAGNYKKKILIHSKSFKFLSSLFQNCKQFETSVFLESLVKILSNDYAMNHYKTTMLSMIPSIDGHNL